MAVPADYANVNARRGRANRADANVCKRIERDETALGQGVTLTQLNGEHVLKASLQGGRYGVATCASCSQ